MVPVSVTVPPPPANPPDGLTEVREGVPETILKRAAVVVPPAVVIVMLVEPDAFVAIANVAVIWVALVVVTLLTVTPELLDFTRAPETKFVPTSVTLTFVPGAPALGVMDVRVGAAELMLKLTGAVVPPAVVMVTLPDPDALEVRANVAVIWVALTTVTLVTVTPEFETLIVAPCKKLVPVKVTLALVPGAAALGLMEVSVGAPEPMLNEMLPLVPPPVVTVTFTGPDALAAMAKVAVI